MTNIEILKAKYNLISTDEKYSKNILSILENYNIKGLYEYNEKRTQITGFYSKAMVELILSQYNIISFGGKEYFFEDGYYKHDSTIKKFIHSKLSIEDKARMRNLKESIEDLKVQTEINPIMVNSNDNLINFQNGIYDIRHDELLPHDSSILSTIQINGEYKQNKVEIESTLFWKYLNSSFSPEVIPVIQELIGYCLSGKTQAEKMFLLYGDGRNGKSVFLSILNSFYNSEFVSAVELKDLTKHEFVARLHNKALNTCADLSNEYINNTGLIKQLFGIDEFEARPLYSNPFKFKNKAKMIFSCNELPSTSDKSFGWIRKLIIINCNKRIEETERIENLDKKIIKNDKDIIISWAIEGLKRLIKNNYVFSKTKEIEESIKDYQLNTNSIKRFINEFCSIGNGKISKNEFMEMYIRYCKSEGLKSLGNRNINLTFKDLEIKELRKELRYWNPISWKPIIKDLSSINPEKEVTGDIDNVIDISEKQYIKEEQEAKQLDLSEFNFE